LEEGVCFDCNIAQGDEIANAETERHGYATAAGGSNMNSVVD